MKDDQRILIAGDSWSQGEFYRFIRNNDHWGDGVTQRSHPGMWHYLLNAYPDAYVANLGISGGHNDNQVDLIHREIHGINPDVIIFFYTCPSRTLAGRVFNKFIDLDWQTLTYKHFEDYCEKFAVETFEKLNSLGYRVLMIGGHVDLPLHLMKDYANLVPIIPSMKNLVDDPLFDHKGTKFPTSYIDYENLERSFWVHGLDHRDHLNINLQNYLTLRHNETLSNQVWPKNPKHFPDNGHAGRTVHKIATDIVVDYLKQNIPQKY